jgi:hypothetical protein
MTVTQGRAVQLDSIKTLVETAYGVSAWDYDIINCFNVCSQFQLAPLQQGSLLRRILPGLLDARQRQGLTLVHIFAQPEPFLSLKSAKHPTHNMGQKVLTLS